MSASCGFNLDPAWSAARTSVSVTLSGAAVSAGSVDPDEGSTRAISTDSGFIYLQTDLTADFAKTYGPYPVSAGSAVTVTDIPAGSYSGMILLFVPSELPSPLSAIVPGEPTTESARLAAQDYLSNYLDACCEASVALIPNVEIKEGVNNALGATLVPITNLTPDVNATNGYGTINLGGDTVKTIRRFMRLTDVSAHYSNAGANAVKTMTMTLHNSTETESLTISSVGLYDSIGARIFRRAESITLPAGSEIPYSVNWSGDDAYYAYIEYTGKNLSCTFSNTVDESATLATVTFDLNGGTGNFSPIAGKPGSTITLPAYAPVRAGFVFMGWSLNKDQTYADFTSGTSYLIPMTDISLYASWSDTIVPMVGAATVCDGSQYITSTVGITIKATCDELGTGVKTILLGGDTVHTGSEKFFIDGSFQDVTYNADQQWYEFSSPVLASNATLSAENISVIDMQGLKTITLQLRDAYGNASDPQSDTIILDSVKPILTVSSITDTSFIATVIEDGSGIASGTAEYQSVIYQSQQTSLKDIMIPGSLSAASWSWETGSYSVTGLPQMTMDGSNTFYNYVILTVADLAGNTQTYYVERIINTDGFISFNLYQ
ncbi:MAG TPA: InlB B-repeat-containing protein [Treponemataceae bacterium]|nr:InlB B-repeat-containing protein [Treponemataceae bacterium]